MNIVEMKSKDYIPTKEEIQLCKTYAEASGNYAEIHILEKYEELISKPYKNNFEYSARNFKTL